MNETHRSAYLGLALGIACLDSHYSGRVLGRSRLSGEEASARARSMNDVSKAKTRKQRMKDAMRRAALGEK